MSNKKFSFHVPHTYVIIFLILIIAALMTWVVPAGQYDRAENPTTHKTMVVPDSFKFTQPSPVGFFGTFVAVQKGLIDAAPIIFFVFLVYGSFYVVMKTGTINNAISALTRRMQGKEVLIIPIIMYVFGLAGAVFGMFEETFGFIPIFISLAIALGYDAIVGMCMVSLAVAIGFASAFMNPFTIGIAQGISELPMYSGLGFRIISFLIFQTLAVWWTLRYAKKVKENPSLSLVKDIDFSSFKTEKSALDVKLTPQQIIILVIVLFTIVFLVYSVLKLGWYIDELAGLFLIMGIASGLIGGLSPSKIAEYFIEGSKDMVFGALVIGLGRSVLVVMQQGQIIDTVIYALSKPLSSLPAWVAGEGMLFVQTIISFFIPSGSGMAAVTMPIMAPLSDVIHLTRQTAVLAFQYGDGFSNILWPTTLAPVVCSIAKVPIDKWWKFFTPFFILLYIVQMVFIAIAVAIHYGPF